ncbi:MAG: hypothetical protein H0V01_02640 [Bacteroidetes bacterium]|nr:hypothetical protein [Bacteroidota bacterium]HET6244707.1 hypothetical protein [Bacteroidia bacterium]
MIKTKFILAIAVTGIISAHTSCDEIQKKAGASTLLQQEWTKQTVSEHVKDWPGTANEAAQAMLEEYGVPDEITNYRLIWHNKGDFRETIVYREEIDHNFPMPHKDVLEQSINYDLPSEKLAEIANYDGSIIIKRTKGIMSATCDKEPMNYLALNLAHEVATGKRSPESARDFYTKTATDFMRGKKNKYTKKLMFIPSTKTGYPDKSTIDDETLEEIFGQR